MSSVVLDKGIKETLVSEIRQFQDSQAWYLERGFPYRRGYLFVSPPMYIPILFYLCLRICIADGLQLRSVTCSTGPQDQEKRP